MLHTHGSRFRGRAASRVVLTESCVVKMGSTGGLDEGKYLG